MNVLFISVRSDAGGGPQHMIDLKEELLRSAPGIRIWLACPDDGDRFQEMATNTQGHFALSHRSFSLAKFFSLLWFCAQNEIDVVHSHGRGAGLYSRMMRFFGFRVVHTFHGAVGPAGAKGAIRLLIDRFLAPLTDAFICVSQDEKKYVLEHRLGSLKSTHVVLNGINVQRFEGRCRRWQSSNLVIGCLARFSNQKGLDFLISHYAAFLKSPVGSSTTLLLGGEGDRAIQYEIEKLISDSGLQNRIQLLGLVKDPVQFFSDIDIYVSTSRFEGLPLTVLEAFASKVPCILSDVIGHRQLIERVRCPSFKVDSSEEFICALGGVIESQEQRRQVIESQFNAVTTEFSLRQMAESTWSVYQSI